MMQTTNWPEKNSKPESPENVSVTSNASVANVTLVTGQTVRVIETENRTYYDVEADVPMHKIETQRGTYVFPDSVDFNTFDMALFNIDLLIEQGLADAESSEIPVIITKTKRTHRGHQTGATTADTDQQLGGVEGYDRQKTLSSIGAFSGDVEKTMASDVSADLSTMEDVNKVYLDRTVKVDLNDSVSAIRGERARKKYNVSGENVTVAVIDTGVDDTHPDLDGSTVVLEKDFSSDGTPDDLSGHGTHVAGIIAGDGDASNGTYVGVAPNASIINAKALGSSGTGQLSDVILAIEFSVNNSADVISMSLGAPVVQDDPLLKASNWAADNGVVVVAAAGNSGYYGHFTVSSPGAASEAITVGASNDDTGEVANFSSRGPAPITGYVKPDVVAPGVGIVSARASGTSGGQTVSSEYTKASGTSMSTPHVAGTAALILDANPGWSEDQVKSSVVTTTDPLAKDYSVYTEGTGQINASRAVDPGLLLSNGTIQYGVLSNTTKTRVVRVTNYGNTTKNVTFQATSKDIVQGTQGNVTLNRTNATLAPGETAAVEATVNISTGAGIYSGQLAVSTNNTSYVAALGYVRGYELTVEKEAYDNGSVSGDPVILFPHDKNNQRFFGQRFTAISGGNTTFFTLSGKYSVWSAGTDEKSTGTGDENGVIMTANTTRVSGDTTVVLNESDTVAYSLNDTEFEDRHGPPANVSVESDLQRPIKYSDGTVVTYQWTYLNTFVKTQTVRFSKGNHNAAVGYRLMPRQYHDNTVVNGTHADSPVVYHLTYPTVGVSGPQEFNVDHATLAAEHRSYNREYTTQRYSVQRYVRHGAWYGLDTALNWDVRDRQRQTVYVTPNMEYRFDVDSEGTTSNWDLEDSLPFVPGQGESYNISINAHPYTGSIVDWELKDTGFSAEGVAQKDQQPIRFMYDNKNADPTTTVYRNGSALIKQTGEVFDVSDSGSVAPGTTYTVVSNAPNPAHTLSTRTKSEWSATHDPNGDSAPPVLTDLQIESMNATNTMLAGTTTVNVTISDGGSVDSVQILVSEEPAPGPAWNDSGVVPGPDWRTVNATHVSGKTYRAELTLGPHQTVHIGVAATDAAGNYVRTVSYDGIRTANQSDAIVSVAGNSEIVPGQNNTVNVTVDPNGADIYGAEFEIYYDGTALNVTSVQRGEFLRADGNDSRVVVSRARRDHVEYGESRVNTSTGVSRAGKLAQVTFYVPEDANVSEERLTLRNVTLVDSDVSTVDSRTRNTTLTRPPAEVRVSPDETTKLEPGDEFTVDVVVESAGYETFGVQANLNYNTSLLNVTSVSGGEFLSSDGNSTLVVTNNTLENQGVVRWGETRQGDTGIRGSGVLYSVTFRVNENASYGASSNLTLKTVKLSDPEASPITAKTTNGSSTLAPAPLPDPTASLVTTTNNVNAPVRINVSATHARNLSRLELVAPDGMVLDTSNCTGTSCEANLTMTPTDHSWNGSAYTNRVFTVRAIDDNNTSDVVTVETPIYMAGDANGDAVVDLFDAVIIGNHWKCERGESCYSDAADLNNDGVVDVFDAVPVGQNWGRSLKS